MIKKQIEKIRDFCFDLIFPIQCLGCKREGAWLCDDCLLKQGFQTQQRCPNCNEINAGQFCQNCKEQYLLDGLVVAFPYDGVIKELIKVCKYHFSKDAGQLLGTLLILFLGKYLVQQAEKTICPIFWNDWQKNLLLPVPLAKRRLRWRGFNQSGIIAKQMADYFQVAVIDGLTRTFGKPQAQLSRLKRRKNLQNVFNWEGQDLLGKNIILIDDVSTTGTTLNECARVLKRAGAKAVWGLVIAKG